MADNNPPSPQATLSPEEKKQRARRNLALALALGGFMIIVFIVTILRLSGASS